MGLGMERSRLGTPLRLEFASDDSVYAVFFLFLVFFFSTYWFFYCPYLLQNLFRTQSSCVSLRFVAVDGSVSNGTTCQLLSTIVCVR